MTAALLRLSLALERLTTLALVPLVALFTGILITAVFKRYLLGTSFVHAFELTRVAFIWATFLAAASGVHRLSHLRVTMLADRLPPAPRRTLEALVQAGMLGFALTLVWHGVIVAERMGATVLPTLAWPQSVIYAAVPVAAAIAAVHAAANLARVLARRDAAGTAP